MPSPTDDETQLPPLSHPVAFNAFGRSHLSPHDARLSPVQRARHFDDQDGGAAALRDTGTERSRSRRRKRAWKKLMWVKQSFPDNYTDQATFLENLQRNPRLKPYDFWPLVADSTIILQHVCSVTIFIVCFVGIFHARVSPVAVVSWSSFGTFVGWLLWERWVSEEEDQEDEAVKTAAAAAAAASASSPSASSTSAPSAMMAMGPISVAARSGSLRRRNRAGSIRRPPHPLMVESLPAGSATAGSVSTMGSTPEATSSTNANTTYLSSSMVYTTNNGHLDAPAPAPAPPTSLHHRSSSSGSVKLTRNASSEFRHDGTEQPLVPLDENRTHQRLETIKSALLIYSTLLGLSPILKSLTRSTSSDSIWAISFWLLAINIFFFDYSGGVGAKFPASLSTNAALMASTVLASRLPQTNQVFSLTLFSLEVFGLFPVFRRHVRHRSWRYHVLQTIVLVLGAGWGVGVVLGDAKDGRWPWRSGIVGMIFSVVISALATGGCSWWLIGLQKYKNEIRGPWDPARPIIMSRTRWDDG